MIGFAFLAYRNCDVDNQLAIKQKQKKSAEFSLNPSITSLHQK